LYHYYTGKVRWVDDRMNGDDICLNIDSSSAVPRVKQQKRVSKTERV